MDYTIIEDIEQGSPEWHALRCGSVGGTGMSKIITSKGERSESRENYLWQIAQEIIEGKSLESWKGNAYTNRGKELEAEARAMFAYENNIELKEVAMIKHNSLYFHVSPDAIFTDETCGYEVKCFGLQEYHDCKKKGILPTKNKLQVQTSLALTGWESWWFHVYFPTLEPLYLKIERDEALIKIIKAEIRLFCREVDRLIEEVKN